MVGKRRRAGAKTIKDDGTENKDNWLGTKTMGQEQRRWGAGTKMMEGRNKDDGLGIKTINKPGIKMIGTMVKKQNKM